MANYYRSMKPAKSWSPLDKLVTRLLFGFNDTFPYAATDGVVRFLAWRRRVPQAKGTQDFLGIDYYTRDYVSFHLLRPGDFFTRRFYRPDAQRSTTGFLANEPQGMFEALKWGLKYKLPIIITENGFDDSDDRVRPGFIAEHIHQVWRGVNFNWPVKGYFHWTLVDNLNGSAAGPSASACGVWTSAPKPASSAPAPTFIPRYAVRTVSRMTWSGATLRPCCPSCSRIEYL
jgi:beta-glucosidase